MKFGEMIKRAKNPLVISPRHEAWLPDNSNPAYSEEALSFGARELLKQATPRDRRGSVSASSLGKCIRKQQFTFLGMPERPYDAKTSQIFQNGTFMHIRWQMAGITEGWLSQAEVPIPKDNEYMLSGTQDGIAYEGSIVELKSINTYGFSSVQTFGPKEEHVFQVGTYMAATQNPKAVILYEDKNTQEYSEHVVEYDADLDHKISLRTDQVWEPITNQHLVEPLSKCIDREGYQYTGCPFRDVCLKVRDWEHAKEIIG